ncbi:MAG: phosphate ABC transporter substrate-binding protein PstS [Sulfurospirillaceae bacterium]|nr:phosphate ABC transporter substrate-binding protein PstS [Sulfurospirillaceae bacterium]
MLRKTVALLLMSVVGLVAGEKINGAGASFPAPLYFDWAHAYEKETSHQINYQSIGSGGGIKQITGRVVDFGASDEPLKSDDDKGLAKVKALQFPAVIGSIVIAHNIAGVKDGELRLKNEVLADIFQGKIKKWNDPKIASDNSNVKLPDAEITVVRRSDGSGTTYNFTYFLAQVSKEWKDALGVGKAVDWPVGLGGKGNEGVTNLVKQTPNSIGYVENAYALNNNLARTTLTTKSGKWVAPSDDSFKASAKYASWTKEGHFYQILTLQPGDNSYPIVAATFILLPVEKTDMNKKVTEFFNWAFEKGDESAAKLGYIPLPKETKDMIRSYWKDHGIAPVK